MESCVALARKAPSWPLLHVDAASFDPVDRALLLAVIDKFAGGRSASTILAAAIGEERDTIEEVYEPFLIQEGCLAGTPKGRVATGRACVHFGRNAPAPGKLL